jgi:hypothetical protein
MIKTAMKITLTVMIAGLLVSAAYAGPITLNKTQMDSITAGGVVMVPAFLCTVNLHGDGLMNAAEHNNTEKVAFNYVDVEKAGGYDANEETYNYVTVTPLGHSLDLRVPEQATNTGTPTHGFSAPGQSSGRDYTAIWNGNN